MIDFITTGSKILALIKGLPEVANSLYKQGQKNEAINRILQELGLSPTEISDDVDTVYTYALIDYSVSECYAILAVLRENEIKNDFLEAYTNNDPLTFFK